jgi:hypothetical protein
MADRIKQNQKLRQAIEDARLRAAKLAKDTEHPDPMDVTYLGLALEVVELRLTWLGNQAEAAKEAKQAAKVGEEPASTETTPTP